MLTSEFSARPDEILKTEGRGNLQWGAYYTGAIEMLLVALLFDYRDKLRESSSVS